jgi:uncharacterized protein YjbI with pentapeptide repeats
MTPKQVNDIFNKLPSKRRKVLVGFLAGHSREKIMIDADVPSDDALTGHLKELYKNFRIVTGWNDADDRRSGARKLPLLISLFARCMPELISDRIPDVLDGVEQEEAIAKPHRELGAAIDASASELSSEQAVLDQSQPSYPLPDTTKNTLEASHTIGAISFLEYFSKAIDQLKSKDVDVHIGAISTLGTLAKYSSPAEHWTIMEYLAAFIRNNAPRKEEEEGEEERSPELREDIQAALTVIGRRDTEKDAPNKKLDLSNTDIRGANLREGKLQGVNLRKANLQGVNFDLANLQGAILKEVNLQGASFYNANLQEEADLRKANLQEACFLGAKLQWAFLSGSNMQGVNLRGAKLKGASLTIANLEGASLDGADLSRANLQGANFMGANLLEVDLAESNVQGTKFRGADLTNAKNIELQQIESAYVDSTTTLPDYLERLRH